MKEIFTVGHSTRSFEELLRLLRRHEIACLVDVRVTPRSRRMPHFTLESLSETLPREGIDYRHEKDLGGWRRPGPHSPNGGWRSKSFQGYADHMASPAYEAALERACELAVSRPTALMCAEALWWRCHRMLISDSLTARGWRVWHIGGRRGLEEHPMTRFAVVENGVLTYPPPQAPLPGT